jgi:importin subunit beta-1
MARFDSIAVALVMGTGFDKYMDGFKPYLFHALDSHEDSQVCIAAVGVVSDLCRALSARIAPLMDEVMARLLSILEVCCCLSLLPQVWRCWWMLRLFQDPKVKRAVKSQVLNCFGDVALALDFGFKRYLPATSKWLSDAVAAAQVTDPVGSLAAIIHF